MIDYNWDSIGKHKRGTGANIIYKHCPFCQGGVNKDKWTFSLNTDNALCLCFRGSCGIKGNYFRLTGNNAFANTPTAIVAERETLYEPYKPVKTIPLTEKAKSYLIVERCIAPEVIEMANLRCDVSPKHNIVFTYYDEEGKPCLTQYSSIDRVNGHRLQWSSKGNKGVFYNKQNISSARSRKLNVCEGLIDCLSGMTMFPDENWTSLPYGCLSGNKTIDNDTMWLLDFKEVVWWFDKDDGGKEGWKRIKHLGNRVGQSWRFKQGKLPRLCKDVNDMLQTKVRKKEL